MRRLFLALVLATGLVGCNPATPVVVAPAPMLSVNAGWHTNLAATTCGDWAHSMTQTQRVTAAGSLVAIFRSMEVSDASAGTEFAPIFATEIGAACTKYYADAPTTGVIAGATMAYMDDLSLHPAHH